LTQKSVTQLLISV
ncbi:unnamed protein product, partial [Allacma fusca]